MKKYALAVALALTATAANAADLGPPKPVVVTEPIIDVLPAVFRTSCYIEGSIGIGINSYDVTGEGASVSFSDHGTIGGLAAGCDYRIQSTPFAIGAIGGVDVSNVTSKLRDGDDTDKITSEPSYYLAGKVGFVPLDHVMVYGLAGASWSELTAKSGGDKGSENFNGWLVGAGVDLMLNRNVTLGARYTADLIDGEQGFDPTNHVVRGTLGWRF